MHESERRVAPFDTDDGIGLRAAVGREVFERPAFKDQRLLDRRLMQRRVHRFTKSRLAEIAARPVHADRRAVDDDAHGFGTANEQPRFRELCGVSQTRSL